MTQPAWTYSQLDSFESCPRKFYHLKVKRDIVEPPTIHTEWGKRVHTAFENAVKDRAPLPEGMQQWQRIADKIVSFRGEKYPEQKFALDRAFKPAGWSNAWTRGIADLVVVNGSKAAVMDYKTGKRKPSEQLDLYAAYAFSHYQNLETVVTGFIWLKEKRIDWKRIERTDVAAVWQSLLPRIAKLESAYERDKWPARTSGLCNGWCPVTTCEFNKKR